MAACTRTRRAGEDPASIYRGSTTGATCHDVHATRLPYGRRDAKSIRTGGKTPLARIAGCRGAHTLPVHHRFHPGSAASRVPVSSHASGGCFRAGQKAMPHQHCERSDANPSGGAGPATTRFTGSLRLRLAMTAVRMATTWAAHLTTPRILSACPGLGRGAASAPAKECCRDRGAGWNSPSRPTPRGPHLRTRRRVGTFGCGTRVAMRGGRLDRRTRDTLLRLASARIPVEEGGFPAGSTLRSDGCGGVL